MSRSDKTRTGSTRNNVPSTVKSRHSPLEFAGTGCKAATSPETNSLKSTSW